MESQKLITPEEARKLATVNAKKNEERFKKEIAFFNEEVNKIKNGQNFVTYLLDEDDDLTDFFMYLKENGYTVKYVRNHEDFREYKISF